MYVADVAVLSNLKRIKDTYLTHHGCNAYNKLFVPVIVIPVILIPTLVLIFTKVV